MAGKSSITPAQAKKLEAAFKATANIAEVARQTGIDYHTIRRWRKAKERPSPEQLLQEGMDKIREGLRLIERSQKPP